MTVLVCYYCCAPYPHYEARCDKCRNPFCKVLTCKICARRYPANVSPAVL